MKSRRLYEINDGVRRAKAATLVGRSRIWATVDGEATYSTADSSQIAELLDWVEAMPFLVAQPGEDRTDSFRNHLRGILEVCPRLRRALAAFDGNHDFYGQAAAGAADLPEQGAA